MFIYPFLLSIFAGILNGTYIFSLKYSNNKSMTWFIFGIITFFIAPAIVLIGSILSHNWFLNPVSVLICLIVGLAFGLGMFLFTKAVNLIGIGIPFALNIA
jgi:drug/metabolite transporter (DMT)-like permease